jgi:hypothetical protein
LQLAELCARASIIIAVIVCVGGKFIREQGGINHERDPKHKGRATNPRMVIFCAPQHCIKIDRVVCALENNLQVNYGAVQRRSATWFNALITKPCTAHTRLHACGRTDGLFNSPTRSSSALWKKRLFIKQLGKQMLHLLLLRWVNWSGGLYSKFSTHACYTSFCSGRCAIMYGGLQSTHTWRRLNRCGKRLARDFIHSIAPHGIGK